MFVIGKRDMEANAVSVRLHGKGNLGAKARGDASRNLAIDFGAQRLRSCSRKTLPAAIGKRHSTAALQTWPPIQPFIDCVWSAAVSPL